MTGFRVFGPVQIQAAGQSVDLGPPKQQAVLAALLVDAGRPVSVDVVVNRVWGDDPPTQARGALYTHIMRLRRVLDRAAQGGAPPATLVRGSAGYTMEVDPDQVDLHRFRRLVGQANDRTAADAQQLAFLREAVSLWQGQPLAGIRGDWAERMRDSWQRQYLDAMVAYSNAELRVGSPALVCGPLRELVLEYPLVEPLAAVLIRALGAVGHTAEALECYAGFRRRLVDELGADPGPELQAAHHALLRDEYDMPRTSVVATSSPRRRADPARPISVDPAASAGEETEPVGLDSDGAASVVDSPGSAHPGIPRPDGKERNRAVRNTSLATGGLLGLSYLTIGLAVLRSASEVIGANGSRTFEATVAGLVVSIAILTVLTLLYARWPRGRWFPAATVAALMVLSATLLPLRPAGDRIAAPTIENGPSGHATVWSAHTTGPAPLFAPGGDLSRTLPVNSAVKVQCEYRGNPPAPWRADGVEYHVVSPDEGHIPGSYLIFGGTDPDLTALRVPRCTHKTSTR